jgi:hypothetical protein
MIATTMMVAMMMLLVWLMTSVSLTPLLGRSPVAACRDWFHDLAEEVQRHRNCGILRQMPSESGDFTALSHQLS